MYCTARILVRRNWIARVINIHTTKARREDWRRKDHKMTRNIERMGTRWTARRQKIKSRACSGELTAEGQGSGMTQGVHYAACFSFCLFQLSMTVLNLMGWNQRGRPPRHIRGAYRSLLSRSGCSSLRRAVSVCMNLLKGVSFFLPPVDDLPGKRGPSSARLSAARKGRVRFFAACLGAPF